MSLSRHPVVLAQTIRVSRRAAPLSCRTLLHRHLTARQASTFTSPAPNPFGEAPFQFDSSEAKEEVPERKSNPRKPHKKTYSSRTAHIRTWEPVESVVDVWALTRALERKYGSILETHFIKDFEVYSKYQVLAWVVFRDPKALLRIPEEGEEFSIYAPTLASKNHWEIGLDDMEQFAEAADYQEGYNFDNPDPEAAKTNRVIGATIVRSMTEHCRDPGYKMLRQRTDWPVAEKFLQWGGFSELDHHPKTMQFNDLFTADSKIDLPRMQAALQLSSHITRLPIPTKPGAEADSLNPLSMAAPAAPSLQKSSQVFAGLENVKQPALAHHNLGEQSPGTSSLDDPAREMRDLEKEHNSQSATTSTIPLPTASQTEEVKAKRIQRSERVKKTLEDQLNAARLLQQSSTPPRRKQPKPRVAVEPKRNEPRIYENAAAQEQKQQEPKSILSKIWRMLGR